MARRYDRGTTSGARRLDNGWLRADGIVARIGVQEYRRGDGSVIRELRLPEEVFSKESLDSLSVAPITDEHPVGDDGSPVMLDALNAQRYVRGHLGGRAEVVDDRLVQAPLLVTDAALVEKVLSGRQAELSVGYHCDLEDARGTWQGEDYDCIQRNIRPNHVAITRAARGGPELRVRLDAVDGVAVTADEALQLRADAAVLAEIRGRLRERRLLEEARAHADAARERRIRDALDAWRRPVPGGMTRAAVLGEPEPQPVSLGPIPGSSRWE